MPAKRKYTSKAGAGYYGRYAPHHINKSAFTPICTRSRLLRPTSLSMHITTPSKPASTIGGRGRYDGKVSFGRGLRKFGQAVKGYSKSLGIEGLRKHAASKARAVAANYIDQAAAEATMGGSGGYARRGLISGRGMYVDNASSLVRQGQYHGPNYSSFKGANSDDGAVTVSNQEFFQYLYAPAAEGENIPYSSFSVPVQPGTMAPLLVQMSSNFERYELKQCMFHFETSLDGSALQSSTGQVGDIMMVSHMDVNRVDFGNASEFEHNSSHVVSARITSGLTCGVECDPKQMTGLLNSGINLVRTNDLSDKTQDLAKFDQARVQIALNNLNPALAGRCLGRIYISYTVKLIKQRLYSAIGRTIVSDEYTFVTPATSWSDAKTKKENNECFKSFVVEDGLGAPSLQNTKETWSNLGTTIRPMHVAEDFDNVYSTMKLAATSASEKFIIDFDDNSAGLFKVTLKAFHMSTGTGIENPDGDFYDVAATYITKLETTGNVDTVPFRDLRTLDKDSDISAVQLANGAPARPLFGNAFTVTSDSTAMSPFAEVNNVIMGTAEFWVRLAPSTSSTKNSVGVTLMGTSGSTTTKYNTIQVTNSTIRIERVNDHERVGTKVISTVA